MEVHFVLLTNPLPDQVRAMVGENIHKTKSGFEYLETLEPTFDPGFVHLTLLKKGAIPWPVTLPAQYVAAIATDSVQAASLGIREDVETSART